MEKNPLKGYVRQANRSRERELGIKNIMARLKDYEAAPEGEKNAGHVDALHRMLGIYLNA